MRKVGMKLPFYAALNPKKPQISRKISTILDYSSTILHLTQGKDHLLRIQDTGACLHVHEASQFIITSDGCTKVFYMLPLLNKPHLTLEKSTRTEGK